MIPMFVAFATQGLIHPDGHKQRECENGAEASYPKHSSPRRKRQLRPYSCSDTGNEIYDGDVT
jgi:hypothetical protein